MQQVYSRFAQHVLIELIFIKIGLKLSYFCQKNTKFLEHGGLHPQTPVTAPPLQNFDYEPARSTDSLVEE